MSDDDGLRVELMHTFRVHVNGNIVEHGWSQRFAKNILIYLLFNRTVTRERLCETMWPELPLSRARRYLRVYLSHLKSLLDQQDDTASILVVHRDDIQLRGTVTCDALDYLQLVNDSLIEQSDVNKTAMCKKVMTSFPPFFFQSIYDPWFLDLRESWEHDITSLLIWLTDLLIHKRSPAEAVFYLRQMNARLPHNEQIIDKLIQCYESSGDRFNKAFWLNQKEKELGMS